MGFWSKYIFENDTRAAEPALETRANPLENPEISLSDPRIFDYLGGTTTSFTGEAVTFETAIGIPAVWAAVDAIASAIASVPIQVFRKVPGGAREKVAENDPLQRILHDQVNDDYLTSVEWRRGLIVNLLMKGRSLTFVERNKAGRVTNLWPLEIDRVTIKMKGHRKTYIERVDDGPARVYEAGEVIDLVWMPGPKTGSHLNPLDVHKNTFGLAIAADRYAARAFKNGGISPLKLKLGSMTGAAAQSAVSGISNALQSGGMVLPLFGDMDLDAIGFDPSKMQLLELKRQLVIEISRIFRIPPTSIQSLENGTYSNTEQGALNFVTKTIQPIVEQIEEELLAKLFSDKNRTHFVKMNLDGLARGDLNSRYAAYQKAIVTGFLTPDEVRSLEDREAYPTGEGAIPWIQSGTQPMSMILNPPAPPPAPTPPVPTDDDPTQDPLPEDPESNGDE